jgi:hypothetical protein
MSVVLRVQLAGPIEGCLSVAVRRALRAILVRAFVSAVTLRTDRTTLGRFPTMPFCDPI